MVFAKCTTMVFAKCTTMIFAKCTTMVLFLDWYLLFQGEMYTMMSRGKGPPQADFFVIPRFGNAFLCKESMCFQLKISKFSGLKKPW